MLERMMMGIALNAGRFHSEKKSHLTSYKMSWNRERLASGEKWPPRAPNINGAVDIDARYRTLAELDRPASDPDSKIRVRAERSSYLIYAKSLSTYIYTIDGSILGQAPTQPPDARFRGFLCFVIRSSSSPSSMITDTVHSMFILTQD